MVNILSKCVIKKDWFSAKYKFMVMKWRNSHQPAEPQDAQHLLTSSFSTWSRQRHPQDKLDKQPHTHTPIRTRPSTFCISIFLILRFCVCSPRPSPWPSPWPSTLGVLVLFRCQCGDGGSSSRWWYTGGWMEEVHLENRESKVSAVVRFIQRQSFTVTHWPYSPPLTECAAAG